VCLKSVVDGNGCSMMMNDRQQVHCSRPCLEATHSVQLLESNIELFKAAREVILTQLTEEELSRAILAEIDALEPNPAMTEDILTAKMNLIACQVVVKSIIAVMNGQQMAGPSRDPMTQSRVFSPPTTTTSQQDVDDDDFRRAMEISLQSSNQSTVGDRKLDDDINRAIKASLTSSKYVHNDDDDIRVAIEASLLPSKRSIAPVAAFTEDEDLYKAIAASLATAPVPPLSSRQAAVSRNVFQPPPPSPPPHIPTLPPLHRSEDTAGLAAAIAMSLAMHATPPAATIGNARVTGDMSDPDLELELALALSLEEK
jgi:hypothetical protein